MSHFKYWGFVILLCSPAFSFAAISFDANGKWETTFDCAEYTIHTGTLVCDGLDEGGAWTTSDGNQTAINAAANNSSGGGGNGAKHWKGSGQDENNSGTFYMVFPTSQRELWVRWYERWQSGFYWGSETVTKSLYFKSSNGNPYLGLSGQTSWRLYESSIVQNPLYSSGGWTTSYPTATSDGTFHCYEAHIKYDSDGTDGVWQMWIDGELVMDHQNLNFGVGGATHPGFTAIEFLSNQHDTEFGSDIYVDVDDMVVYNQTPPNTDASGNAFIGPIGASLGNANCAGGTASSTGGTVNVTIQ